MSSATNKFFQTDHLIDAFEIASPALSAPVLAFGMPALFHHPAYPAHGVRGGNPENMPGNENLSSSWIN